MKGFALFLASVRLLGCRRLLDKTWLALTIISGSQLKINVRTQFSDLNDFKVENFVKNYDFSLEFVQNEQTFVQNDREMVNNCLTEVRNQDLLLLREQLALHYYENVLKLGKRGAILLVFGKFDQEFDTDFPQSLVKIKVHHAFQEGL